MLRHRRRWRRRAARRVASGTGGFVRISPPGDSAGGFGFEGPSGDGGDASEGRRGGSLVASGGTTTEFSVLQTATHGSVTICASLASGIASAAKTLRAKLPLFR